MIIPWGSDLTTQYLPWYYIASNYLHSFSLPHWVPNIYSHGYPLLAEGEIGILSPINSFFLFFFPFDLAVDLLYLFYFSISIIGTFCFLRANRLSKASAVFGGIVFSLSGFMVSRYFQPGIVFTSALMPFGFFVVLKSIKDYRFRFSLPFIIYLQITAGHLQMTLISCLGYFTFLFFYVIKSKGGLRLIFKTLLAIIIGFGLSAPQILPSFKLFQISERRDWNPAIRYSYSLPASYLLTYVSPYAFGISEPGDNLGFRGFGGSFWEFNLTIWTLPFLLTLIGITTLTDKKNKLAFVLILIWLVFMLLSFGGYFKPYRIIGHLPSFPFRAPSRFLLICTFAASCLSAVGFERLFSKRPVMIRVIVLMIVFASIIFQQQTMFQHYFKFIDWGKLKLLFADLSNYQMTSALYIDKSVNITNLYDNHVNIFREEFQKGLIAAVSSLGFLYLWWLKEAGKIPKYPGHS